MYESLAKFYDKFIAGVDYKLYASRLEKLFSKYRFKPREILDLGCGTGTLTLELASRGYDMTGADISVEMLEIAGEKAAAAGDKSTLFINQDITCLDLYGTVDAAVASLDVVNHLTRKTELRACFKGVSLFLIPNGLFIFDINLTYKFENVYADNVYAFEDGNDTCIWRNSYDRRRGICDFYLTYFCERDGLYTRADEQFGERMYTLDEIKEALESAGMEMLCVTDEKLRPLEERSQRAIITAVNRK